MCSTIVARESGTIVKMALTRRPLLKSAAENRENTVRSPWMGRPIHAASLTVSATWARAAGSMISAKT